VLAAYLVTVIVLLEPSLLFQLVGKTKEKSIDLNIVQKIQDFGKFGSPLLYRRSFMAPNILMVLAFLNKTAIRYLIVGVNFNKFMVAYTYSHVMVPLSSIGGYHQPLG
jgi:hypothetical protein